MILYKTRQEAIDAVKNDGKALQYAEAKFKDDDEIVALALASGGLLEHASVRLKYDTKYVLLEAMYINPYDASFDKALFCAKQDIAFAKKFNKYYGESDEFQIELRLFYGDKYQSTINKYNTMSFDKLQSELQKFRKKQVDIARNIYLKGYGMDYLINHSELYMQNGHSDLLWGAIYLRENGKPFSELSDYLINPILRMKKTIDIYCSQKISGSYPERLLSSLLTMIGVDYGREMVFPWSEKVERDDGSVSTKRYDFYVPELNAIIEIHGSQHYDGGFESVGGRTLEEEIRNDKEKAQLAKINGIKHYIVIDANYSNLSYIKESIISNNEFISLFNISEVDWSKVEEGTSIIVRTDLEFPLYEEIKRRCNTWIDVINLSLTSDDNISLESIRRKPSDTVTKELQKNINDAYPSRCGLYPHELVLLSEAHRYRYPIGENRIPEKWYYDYGIGDAGAVLNRLLSKGFLSVGDVRDSIEHSTLPVIKRVLTAHKLSTKGKKSDLINLLLENISLENLEKEFPEKYLQLTDKGRIELEENYYLLNNNSKLTIWTLNKIFHAYPGEDPATILFECKHNPIRYAKYLSEEEKQNLNIPRRIGRKEDNKSSTKTGGESNSIKCTSTTQCEIQTEYRAEKSVEQNNFKINLLNIFKILKK